MQEANLEILILKETTAGGKKLAKDTILDLPKTEAQKLIDKGDAKLNKS